MRDPGSHRYDVLPLPSPCKNHPVTVTLTHYLAHASLYSYVQYIVHTFTIMLASLMSSVVTNSHEVMSLCT